MLHYIESSSLKGVGGWSISKDKFLELLDCIEAKGLTTTTFTEIEEVKSINLKKSVIITFDDCPENLFEFVVPELIRRKMKASFYIPTAYIGSYNKWDVKEQNFDRIALAKTEHLIFLNEHQMEIGSHGHRHLNQLKIDYDMQSYELEHSKNILEELLDRPIYSFAHPYGEVSKNYKKLLSDSGYRYGLSIYKGNMNRYALRRIGIHETDSKASILFKLSGLYGSLRYLVDPFLSIKKFGLKVKLFILGTYFSNFFPMLSQLYELHFCSLTFNLH